MSTEKTIFCCGCSKKVNARLTNGEEIYPHRQDLYELPFWKCDTCNNYVGCHHKTVNRTNPLGHISTAEMRKARIHIHSLIDPLWKSKKITRNQLYSEITKAVGWKFHTGKLRTIEEARNVYHIASQIKRKLSQ